MKLDGIGVLLGVISAIATIAGLFSQQYQIAVFMGGLIGLAISAVFVKMNEYLSKINQHEKEIKEIKKEMDYYKKHLELKSEIELLKEINKRGKR